MPDRKPPKVKNKLSPAATDALLAGLPRRGRPPPYEPTAAGRSQVAAMVIADIGQDMIAACLRITSRTLRKYYRRELDTSYAIIKAEIAGKVVTMARGGDARCAMFYLECHGWVRSERLVVADGGIDDSDVRNLSDDELNRRIAALKKRRG